MAYKQKAFKSFDLKAFCFCGAEGTNFELWQ